MYTITRQIEIDAGHRVPFHDSKCKFLHGHRWKIIAEVGAEVVQTPDGYNPESGMVMDFGNIKSVLMTCIHDNFDHKLILWDQDPLLDIGWAAQGIVNDSVEFVAALDKIGIREGLVQVPVIPTSENLARYWAFLITPELYSSQHWLAALHVWETPNCQATFRFSNPHNPYKDLRDFQDVMRKT